MIGQSLGSVIMFDILQKVLPTVSQGLLAGASRGSEEEASPARGEGAVSSAAEDADVVVNMTHVASKESTSGMPLPRCVFAVGSPLGMFLSIRLSKDRQCP